MPDEQAPAAGSGHALSNLFLVGESVVEDVPVYGSHINSLTITDCRCIFWSAKLDYITEFPRDRLSSMDFVCWNIWHLGIVLMVVGLGLCAGAAFTDDWLQLGLGGGGALSLILGVALMFDYEVVKFWVVGRADAVEVSKVRYVWVSKRAGLYGLLKKLRSLK